MILRFLYDRRVKIEVAILCYTGIDVGFYPLRVKYEIMEGVGNLSESWLSYDMKYAIKFVSSIGLSTLEYLEK